MCSSKGRRGAGLTYDMMRTVEVGARLNGRIIPIRGISAQDERAWRDLAERAIEPNPFYEADCVIPAARHQLFGSEINLAVAEHDGRFVGCMPIRATHRWKFPYPVVTSQVRRMGYLGTPLVDPEAGPDAAEAMLKVISTQRRALHSRILLIDTSGADGQVAGYVRSAASRLGFPLRAYEFWERGKLERLETPTYDLIHSSKTRYNLRRQRRMLEKEIGSGVSLVDRTADPTALDEYVELESRGYKASEGVAMTTVPGEPEYFVDMCRRFAAAGRLHVLALQAGDKALAMEIWARGGDGLFLMKISYDEEFKRYGPGVLLQMEAMEYFHDHTDASWIDTCTSDGNELLLRLYPGRRKVEMLSVILGPSLVDRAVVAGFVALRPLHSRWYELTGRKVKTEVDDADQTNKITNEIEPIPGTFPTDENVRGPQADDESESPDSRGATPGGEPIREDATSLATVNAPRTRVSRATPRGPAHERSRKRFNPVRDG